jgi:hypothetical protein
MLIKNRLLTFHRIFHISIIILSTSFFMTGCSSNNTLQTAKVLPENTMLVGGAAQFYPNGYVIHSQYSNKIGPGYHGPGSAYGSLWALIRKGLGYNMDIGLNLSVYSLELNYKYQVLNLGNYYLATGIGSYYGYKPDIIDGGPGDHSLDIILPIYMSYDVSKRYSVYTSGKYIIRNIYSKYQDRKHVRRYLVSGALGNKIMITDNYSLLFEGALSKVIGIQQYSFQANTGVCKEF